MSRQELRRIDFLIFTSFCLGVLPGLKTGTQLLFKNPPEFLQMPQTCTE